MANRPKIGVALSGASGRAIAHIGVLEVLKEHNIPIDVVTACSSGTVVAASYACGSMEQLKTDWLAMNTKFLLSLFKLDTSGRGLLSTEKAAEWMRTYLGEKKFEEVRPRLGFVCVDILTGEPFVFALGDIAKAGQASCAIPGLFEPVQWGNRLLVDGGLFSFVPVKEARDLGADIVIGIDIAATRQIIKKRYLHVWRGYDLIRRSLPGRLIGQLFSIFNRIYEKSAKVIFYNQSDFLENEILKSNDIDLFSILGKAMNLVYERQRKGLANLPVCDMMLVPNVKKYNRLGIGNLEAIYREGRRVALEAIPDIKKLIQDWEWRRKAEVRLKVQKPAVGVVK